MFSSQNSQVSNDAVFVEDIFSTYLYTGNGSTQTINNGIDLAGEGGIVWTKVRNQTFNHSITYQDSSSTLAYVMPNATNEAYTSWQTDFAYNSNGFSLNNSYGMWNGSGNTYASWTFRKQPKFFDVVTWTGSGANRNISHNLNSVPACIMVKRTDTTSDWQVYHRANTAAPATDYLVLNSNANTVDLNTVWNDTAPTDSVFYVGTNATVNASGGTYVAYLFAHDAGGFGLSGTDNVISCGSYTGNGSATGPVVTLGYEPQWLMIKKTNGAGVGAWMIIDNMRGMPVGSNTAFLAANLTDAESATIPLVSPTATGFNVTTTNLNLNTSGATYIYIAIRRGPMKVPTSGTSVFNTLTALNSTTVGVPRYQPGFSPDMTIIQARGAGFSNYSSSRLLNGTTLTPQTSAAEVSDAFYSFSFQNGFGANGSGTAPTTTSADWFFKRAPSFFDVVCYTGTGSARTISHNLGVAPELMIVKSRSAIENWQVYAQSLGASQRLQLQSANAASGASAAIWNSTSPTASVFSVGTDTAVNGSGSTYVAYLFATCAGVSKVGSYTGNGSSQTINCGFTSGARFILIRKTNDTQSWYVFDSARGIVSGNDPVLLLNTTDSEFTTYDSVDPNSTGFVVNSDLIGLNDSGGNYIFLAIA